MYGIAYLKTHPQATQAEFLAERLLQLSLTNCRVPQGSCRDWLTRLYQSLKGFPLEAEQVFAINFGLADPYVSTLACSPK